MNLRAIGAIATFLLVFLGLMYKVGDVNVENFFILLCLSSIAGLIGWFKLFKPSSRSERN